MPVYFKTDRGKVRPINEDAGGIFKNKAGQILAVVADGMGGHKAGDVASSLAVSLLKEAWETAETMSTSEVAISWLEEHFHKANDKILARANENNDCQGMGTTVTAAIVIDHHLMVGHVGDSRLYVHKESKVELVTRDHTFVQELVLQGEITDEEAEHHPKKNVLTRAVGTEEQLKIQTIEIPLEGIDHLLLCTDGLSNKLSEQDFLEILNQSIELEEKADLLVDTANERGGEDNITVLVWMNDGNEEGVT